MSKTFKPRRRAEPFAVSHRAALAFLGVSKRRADELVLQGDWPGSLNLAPVGQPMRRRYRMSDLEVYALRERLEAESGRLNRQARAEVGI